MHFFDSIPTTIVGQFGVDHLILAMLVIATLFIAERYYSRNR
jgi:hypothetical protein